MSRRGQVGTVVEPSPPARRRVLGWVVLLAVVAGWWVTLAPTSIGGPTSYVVVVGTSMEPRWRTGDVVVTRAAPSYGTGDVVAFRAEGGMVIHRITGGDASSGFTTQGDNRETADSWSTKSEDVVGAEWFTLPVDIRTLLRWGPWAGGLFVFALVAWPTRKKVPAPQIDPEEELTCAR